MVITVLSLPGGVVQAFLCHQTLMRAALGDASVIEIQDLIGILHRRNAVGNDDLGNIFFLGEMALEFRIRSPYRRAEVESSSTRIGACFARARAMERRCF